MIRLYNKQTGWLGREQEDWEGLHTSEDVVKLEVEKQERPTPSKWQRVEKTETIDVDLLRFTVNYQLIDYTEKEIEAVREAEAQAADSEISVELLKEDLRGKVDKGELPGNVDKYLTLYPYFRVNREYKVEDIFRFKGELYEVIQAHTSQVDWMPNELPALYKRVRQEIEQWVQPTGAHDAYGMGERVIHNGHLWESLHESNIWEPPTQWKDLGKI